MPEVSGLGLINACDVSGAGERGSGELTSLSGVSLRILSLGLNTSLLGPVVLLGEIGVVDPDLTGGVGSLRPVPRVLLAGNEGP